MYTVYARTAKFVFLHIRHEKWDWSQGGHRQQEIKSYFIGQVFWEYACGAPRA